MFLFLAIGMTLAQLWIADLPEIGQAIGAYPHMHGLAHLASFGALAFAWACAFPAVPTSAAALGVGTFGFVQEALEIVGHSHHFELRDALIDLLGAVAGAAVARGYLYWRTRPRNGH